MKFLQSSGFLALTFTLAGSVGATRGSAYTLGQYLEGAESWLRCDMNNPTERLICSAVSQEVTNRLNASNIRFVQGDLAFSSNGFANINKSEGCKKLSTLSSNLTAVVDTHVPIVFKGNLIESPFMATLTLPSTVNANIRVREATRTKVPVINKCADPTNSDDWNFVGNAQGTLIAKIVISMEPKFYPMANGEYEISLRPFVGVDLALDNPNMKFAIKGRDSALISVSDTYNAISGISTGLGTPVFLFDGLSVESFVKNWRATAFDAGAAIFDAALVVDNAVLQQSIQKKASRKLESAAEKMAREALQDLENSLNKQIRKALGLDGVGEVWMRLSLNGNTPRVTYGTGSTHNGNLRLNNGSGSFGGSYKVTSDPYYGDRATGFADINGDGQADFFVINSIGAYVRYNQGGLTFSNTVQLTADAFYGTRASGFADVNGDGFADLYVVNDDGSYVRFNNQNGSFSATVGLSNDPYYGTKATLFADINADRYADFVVVNDLGSYVRYGNGSGFGGTVQMTQDAFYGQKATGFADLNADGYADFYVVNTEGASVRYNSGQGGFRDTQRITWDAYYGTFATGFADLNGDRAADFFVVN